MIQLLIALTLIGSVRSHATMCETISDLNPCLLSMEPIQILLRANPRDRKEIIRQDRSLYSDIDWDELNKVFDSDEPVQIPTKDPIPDDSL